MSPRSVARATFSAYKALPIRWRLAGGSAALTFVILAGFAAIVGAMTSNQVRGQFNDEVRSAADQLQQRLEHKLRYVNGVLGNSCFQTVSLSDYTSAEHAQIRIYDDYGVLLCTQNEVKIKGQKALPATPDFPPPSGSGTFQELGYRVAARQLRVSPSGQVMLLYARPLSDVDHTLARVQFVLLLSVLGGTVLALLAGLWTAQRAMGPISQLTDAAREIRRTRDPSRRLPQVRADDEVAELARTLELMLEALAAARSETESALDRQREFVADASHELRTPLTSVLANLELLTEELHGEQAETAQAALRATRRMRRLVGDLLLLARADTKRVQPRRATDLADVLMDVAAELGAIAEDHDLSIDARPAVVRGVPDDLHRLMLNLIENALCHTPAGTHVVASTDVEGQEAVITVQDDGPGIPSELRPRVFERFVRGGRDGARGSGLGLAIVRAVSESHAGSVALEHPRRGTGTRFVIRIPLDGEAPAPEPTDRGQADGVRASATAGGARRVARVRRRS